MSSRNTVQRQLILQAVRALRCHATAEQIYLAVSREHPAVSRATVYRNLELLAEHGEIRRVDTVSGPTLYDPLTLPHYHLRCRGCGRYFDVDMDELRGLERHIRDRKGFAVEGYDILFSGLCPECREL